jgi:anionic cell wall polymer biosynthesis LytR-Cps2A-Psr (LCP) family protein
VFASRAGKLIAGKVGYAATCLLAAVTLVVSGYAHQVTNLVSATEKGIAINGSPVVGAMTILVMGLESRTDYEGNVLPNNLLTAMHAGRASAVAAGQVGAQDTNTLILIHIFAGGQKAVGFSIPRDDLVTYPKPTYLGITKGKIDQAYDFAYNLSLQQTSGTHDSQNQRYLLANQAGQQFEIDTVQALTGVRIDHFLEVNLIGFFYLASAFHGIEVCIKPYPGNHGLNLTDFDPFSGINHSGFNAYLDGYNRKKGGAQYLHLSAPQALAYVRSRDTLPGTDIGRTSRQQATIDYVIWKLRHDGVLSDIGTLNALLGTVSKVLITDRYFNLLDFATNMRAFTGDHISFTTLKTAGSENNVPLNGFPQDVLLVNVPEIQQIVKSAFYPRPATAKTAKPVGGAKKKTAAPAPPAPPPSTVTVDVYNGNNLANGLAGKFSAALTALGYKAGAVNNASAQSQPVTAATQVFYGAGAAANAVKIATEIGTKATALTSLPAGHVEVLTGSTVTGVPAGLASPATPATGTPGAGASHPAAPASSPASGAGGGGGAIKVSPNARYGVPCVY